MNKSDEDDWENLKSVLKYIKGTRHLNLTLIAGDISVGKWWLEASLTVHKYCQEHKGSMIPLGKLSVTFSTQKKR